MVNFKFMKNIILKIMGEFKWFITFGILVSYILFFLLMFYFNKINNSFFFTSIIILLIFVGSIWNTSLTLFPSLNDNSSDADILLRGFIIFLFGIVFYIFLFVELVA
ncbi:hypothetical protein V6C59_21060 [Acinetobacter bereziniae]|uniref:hypothetical protein n=1 Tax=Acinetobacter bereziniae TaxID=106648 RepID=UPI002FDA4151